MEIPTAKVLQGVGLIAMIIGGFGCALFLFNYQMAIIGPVLMAAGIMIIIIIMIMIIIIMNTVDSRLFETLRRIRIYFE